MILNYKSPRGKKKGKFHDIGLDNNFVDMSTKAYITKAKIGKWDLIKLKGSVW
jgi:hypothetical protein